MPNPVPHSQTPCEIIIVRQKRAWDLRQQGWTHQRIADELKVERSTVSKYLLTMSRAASKSIIDQAVEKKVAQLGQLERIIDEALQAWERSKEQTNMATKKTVLEGKEKDGREEITQRSEQNTGDPRYLSQAQAAMADIRKMLGLDHPLKLLQLDFSKLTDDQLDAIAKGNDPFTVITNE